jgi:hypothetical protein
MLENVKNVRHFEVNIRKTIFRADKHLCFNYTTMSYIECLSQWLILFLIVSVKQKSCPNTMLGQGEKS